MKIRHLTATILIGWYLMFPPLVTRSGKIYMEPNVAAPLTEWRAAALENGTTLDSERICENSRSVLASNAKKLLLGAPANIEEKPLDTSERAGTWVFALEAIKSRCIASDDPRLKTK
jgi:hypothetical protein